VSGFNGLLGSGQMSSVATEKERKMYDLAKKKHEQSRYLDHRPRRAVDAPGWFGEAVNVGLMGALAAMGAGLHNEL